MSGGEVALVRHGDRFGYPTVSPLAQETVLVETEHQRCRKHRSPMGQTKDLRSLHELNRMSTLLTTNA